MEEVVRGYSMRRQEGRWDSEDFAGQRSCRRGWGMGDLEKKNWFLLGLAGPKGCDPLSPGQNWRPPWSWPAAPGVGLGICLANQFGKPVSSVMSSSCCVLCVTGSDKRLGLEEKGAWVQVLRDGEGVTLQYRKLGGK